MSEATEKGTQTQTEPTAEEMYGKLVEGKMSLDDVEKAEQTTPADDKTQDPANETDASKKASEPAGAEPTEPVNPESLETYKAKSEAEIARLNKIAKDNQASFTTKSQELSAARKEILALQEKLAQYEQSKVDEIDVDLKAFDDYPEEIKASFVKLNERNKALAQQLKEVAGFVQSAKSRQAQTVAEQQKVQEYAREFRENILPEILKEAPDYDDFIRQNIEGYSKWANTLSEGEKFSFLYSKDPRDLLRGYKEYKKLLNQPYETQAIKQTNTENNELKQLYTGSTVATKRTVQPQTAPKLTEHEQWEREMKRQQAEYDVITQIK